jgi:hypothetical protein
MKYVGALGHVNESIPTLYYAVAGAIFPLSVIVGILRGSGRRAVGVNTSRGFASVVVQCLF